MLPARSTDVPEARLDRAAGALWGLALGDALGMPTQMLSRAEVVARWGPLLAGFEAPGRASDRAGLPAGSVTDDTEQAVLLGRLLVEGGGRAEPGALAEALLAWEERMRPVDRPTSWARRRGARSRRSAPASPAEEAGRTGSTNGAAMRVAPIGIVCPPDDLERLVDRVVEVSAITHGTSAGLAGAAPWPPP
jgi:ADP-ribosylglycohydrolase